VSARATAFWSATCLVIVLSTTNPVYRALVLLAGLMLALTSTRIRGMRSPRRAHRILVAVAIAGVITSLLNMALSHIGATVLFALPEWIPGLGGPYTLEALVFGLTTGITIGACLLAVAPFSLLLGPEDMLDALPAALSRTGSAVAVAVNMVPVVATSFQSVSEAQRLRGWRARGPRSWSELVVPVVLTTIEGSIQLAESMEARAYGSGPRTHLAPPRLGLRDWTLIAASASAFLLFGGARLAGLVPDWYPYPTMAVPDLSIPAVAACLLLLTPVLTWRWPS
jgi:energy-coupling factor transport system permease protein